MRENVSRSEMKCQAIFINLCPHFAAQVDLQQVVLTCLHA